MHLQSTTAPAMLESTLDSPGADAARGALPGGEPAASEMTVYQALAVHQRCEEWDCRDLLCCLQEWAVRFAVEFELVIPELVLRVDTLPRSCLGHFRPGHNGFGLRGEIAINAIYVRSLGLWEVLGVLLHEMIHAWQFAHGTPSEGNHHNTEFRRKAEELGLNIGRRGVTGFHAESRFRDLLREHGIVMPDGDIPAQERRVRGDSKMKKWTCGCGVNVRCAITDFQAQCLKCGHVFRRTD